MSPADVPPPAVDPGPGDRSPSGVDPGPDPRDRSPSGVDAGPAVRYEVAGGVATLTMDQLATRNALTPALLEGLANGMARAEADPDVRVVVLTHTGPAFCAGADLRAAPRPPAVAGGADRRTAPADPAADAGDDLHLPAGTPAAAGSGGDRRGAPSPPPGAGGLPAVLDAIAHSPLPVIARLAGHAMGGGVGLAAVCDISMASVDVLLGFTEVRLGVAPAVISVVCLPKLRRGDALELFLTGERITAVRAADIGLITRAVAADELDATIARYVELLVAGGPQALGAAKALVYDVPGLDTAAAYEHLSELSARLFASEEGIEGRAAFRQKRPAAWSPAVSAGAS